MSILANKSNLKVQTTMMTIANSAENKENMRSVNLNQQQQSQDVLLHEIESRDAWNDQGGMEPLDYRQDWSQEIIDTFGKLQSCYHLEKALIR